MTKVARDPGRLLELLYNSTSKAVGANVAKITQHLYGGGGAGMKSTLDELMENDWKQKPKVEAMKDISRIAGAAGVKSTVLKVTSADSFLTKSDFNFLYPVKRDRQYKVDGNLQFTVVKKRHSSNLVFGGGYYLVFRNYNEACLYMLETIGKRLNGGRIDLGFAGVGEVVDGVSTKWLQPANSSEQSESGQTRQSESLTSQTTTSTNSSLTASSLTASSPAATLINNILNYKTQNPNYDPEKYTTTDPHYNLLNQLINTKLRRRSVLVRNLPINLSHFSLMKLLWNYDFPPLRDLRLCFTTVVQDARRQTTLTLIEFADSKNALRFVRNFHGKPWDSMHNSTKKEIKLYGPVLCEVIES